MLVVLYFMLGLQILAFLYIVFEDKTDLTSSFLFVTSVISTLALLELKGREYKCESKHNVFSCSIEFVPTTEEPNE